ncbi:MAG TPA: hypothetical protein VMU26_05255, partial [Candidatus Polarisedimenticolia bacterium]|nr:hypothetical protein [Candidatus Polarisedimenticolia bacterium]
TFSMTAQRGIHWRPAQKAGNFIPHSSQPMASASLESENRTRSSEPPSYQIMLGKTLFFLPPRNGMVSNTAHILLHLATAGTLIALLMK